MEWYGLAAEQGHAAAAFSLGFMYANGKGVAKDAAKAVEWYGLAAAQGFAPAQQRIKEFIPSVSNEARPEEAPSNNGGQARLADANPTAPAMKSFRLAARGFPEAQFNVGVMYHNGEGVPQDFGEAAKWYQLAAKQGHALAQQRINELIPPEPDKKSRGQVPSNKGGRGVADPNPTAHSDFRAVKQYFPVLLPIAVTAIVFSTNGGLALSLTIGLSVFGSMVGYSIGDDILKKLFGFFVGFIVTYALAGTVIYGILGIKTIGGFDPDDYGGSGEAGFCYRGDCE